MEETKELTQEQIDDLRYFWQEKGNLERYCDFEKLKPQIEKQLPLLFKAWNDYKLSIENLNMVVDNL